MSYLVKQNSSILFGSSGVNAEMKEQGYIRTLCTACRDKNTGEECFVDLHLTLSQINKLALASASVVFNELGTDQSSFWVRKSPAPDSVHSAVWHCLSSPDYTPLCGHLFPTEFEYSQSFHGVPLSSFCPECKKLLEGMSNG